MEILETEIVIGIGDILGIVTRIGQFGPKFTKTFSNHDCTNDGDLGHGNRWYFGYYIYFVKLTIQFSYQGWNWFWNVSANPGWLGTLELRRIEIDFFFSQFLNIFSRKTWKRNPQTIRNICSSSKTTMEILHFWWPQN